MSATVAPLRPRRAWLQPRFLFGVLLVLASVVGVGALLAATDRTELVFAARHQLAQGDALGPADLVGVRVRLGQASGDYLAARPRAGTVVTRTIAKGELVPLGALGTAAAQSTTSIVVPVGDSLPASVTGGDEVDVWSAAALPAQKYGPPQVIVSQATVVRVARDSGLGASGDTAVELRVPRDATAALLAAIADGDAVSVVPVGG